MVILYEDCSVGFSDLYDHSSIMFVDDIMLDWNRFLTEENEPLPDYSKYSDNELLNLTPDEVSNITDANILQRVAKLNSDLLSDNQKNVLYFSFDKKSQLSGSDVKDILTSIKTAKRAIYVPSNKNNTFVDKYDISDSDMLNYVKKLTIGDYVCSTIYKDNFLLGHNLIIFEPTRAMVLENGSTITGITVYVKIDLDYKNKDAVFLISFHETDQTDFRPYRK